MFGTISYNYNSVSQNENHSCELKLHQVSLLKGVLFSLWKQLYDASVGLEELCQVLEDNPDDLAWA